MPVSREKSRLEGQERLARREVGRAAGGINRVRRRARARSGVDDAGTTRAGSKGSSQGQHVTDRCAAGGDTTDTYTLVVVNEVAVSTRCRAGHGRAVGDRD